MRAHVIRADARHLPLADRSVQCVVTSPPYFNLRDYGVDGQIGIEESPDDYVAAMVIVFDEVMRVLRDDGVAWINLGDGYASNAGGYSADGSRGVTSTLSAGTRAAVQKTGIRANGHKPKDLYGIPWRVAFALRDAGWYLRSEVIWHKPNPMPSSVTDRPVVAHEHMFMLSKSPNYFYDAEAVAEPAVTAGGRAGYAGYAARAVSMGREPSGNEKPGARVVNKEMRSKRTVWTIPTQPYEEAHFAAMPEALILPCVLSSSRPGDVVFDPFTGSGTVGVVAVKRGRLFYGTELKQEYIHLAQERIAGAVIDMGLATPETKSKRPVQLGLLSLPAKGYVDTEQSSQVTHEGQLGLFE